MERYRRSRDGQRMRAWCEHFFETDPAIQRLKREFIERLTARRERDPGNAPALGGAKAQGVG